MIGFFNGQTEYSFLENAISLENYVSNAVKYNYDFLTISDTNMHGYYNFYNLCKKNNIIPIIGLKIKLPNTTLLAYAKCDKGLQNLFKLTKEQEEKGIIDNIQNYKEGLFFVTNDESHINKLINSNNYNEFLIEFEKFNDIELYVGVKMENEFLKRKNIKTLPISNAKYLLKEDYNVYKTLITIGNIPKSDANHLPLSNELSIKCDNTFINEIKYENVTKKISLPIYDSSIDSAKYLKELSIKGLNRRLLLSNKGNLFNDYINRLNHELEVINSMDYNDYFLIVWDLIKYAKKNGILVGPGRGSAAGSLLSYCLGITEIDPMEYNLYFERFLNPQRISMPDIDIDFPDNKREEVIQYVKNKYGQNNVCYISAFSTFGVKSSIRDVCKCYNINVDHTNLILKYIEDYSFTEAIEKYSTREELLEVLQISQKISGLVRHVSTHAAGIILSSVGLDSNIPLRIGVNGVYQSQLDSVNLEKKGFLKIDFLGIRNLTLVDKVIKKLNLKLSDIKLNDKKTFELLQKADTDGIFQLESYGIKSVLRKLNPTTFNDIVSVLALYRPGPMENIDIFISQKNSKNISYISQSLKPILESTNGIIVYQEQIMQIANVIAGYSFAEADILRRAMSKKDKKTLDDNKEEFISRAKLKGFDYEISSKIYDLILKFADYGFNKSHSVAYALLSYQMAYLKANYPIEFISQMINNCISDKKELIQYIQYAKSKGIEVIAPKINHSTDEVMILKNRILLPFTAINKFGSNNAKELVVERKRGKFLSFDDFKERTKFLNDVNIEGLIHCCSLDEFNITKKEMIEVDNNSFAKYLKDEVSAEEYTYEYLREKEIHSLGLNINYDIFKKNEESIKRYNVIKEDYVIKSDSKFNVVAFVDSIKEIETKKKEKMAFVNLDLNFSKIQGVVFPSSFNEFNLLDKNKLIIIEATIQLRNNDMQIVVNRSYNIK